MSPARSGETDGAATVGLVAAMRRRRKGLR
jgi:hypothetical protein